VCECEVCKKWDRVLCGECTLRKFGELTERIILIEKTLSSHAYVGVPEQFEIIKERLSRIEKLLRGLEEWA